jgi:hypothetical protein
VTADPMRFRVADNQAQRTLGGNIMEVHPDGPYVLFGDYARLKAEVERHIKARHNDDMAMSEKEDPLLIPRHLVVWWMDECKKAQAEVERLTKAMESSSYYFLSIKLKAEVERLTKAGDLMCRMAGNNQVINRHWKTAKKGVQS